MPPTLGIVGMNWVKLITRVPGVIASLKDGAYNPVVKVNVFGVTPNLREELSKLVARAITLGVTLVSSAGAK